jgi:hypothetical protein
METQNPRAGKGARAGMSIAADVGSLTKKSFPRLAPDALARYRAAHLIQTFGLHPEIAWALSAVAFGGAT